MGADVEPQEVRAAMKRRHQHIIRGISSRLFRRNTHGVEPTDPEDGTNEKALAVEQELDMEPEITAARLTVHKDVSFHDEVTVVDSAFVPMRPPSSIRIIAEENIDPSTAPAPAVSKYGRVEELTPGTARARRALQILKGVLQSLCMPASLSILISFVIVLIKPLKALFVAIDGYYMPSAPDGQAPLAVLYDFADFMGAACVPLNLVCLGSALARLNIPRNQWSSLPLGAIFSLAVGRMLLMPVLGVLICEGMIHVNFISRSDKVLQFICM